METEMYVYLKVQFLRLEARSHRNHFLLFGVFSPGHCEK